MVLSLLAFMVVLCGLASDGLAVRFLFIMSSFSAMAVIPTSWIGGTNITPGSMAALILLVRYMKRPSIFQGILTACLDRKKLGWLFVFFLIAFVGAFLLPRLFAGRILAYQLSTAKLSYVMPSGTNITQASYLFLSVMIAMVVSVAIVKQKNFFNLLLRGFYAGGLAVIGTGLLDIVANLLGHGALLKVFYSAEYGYSGGAINGSRRVLGLTPEPSAFGSHAMAFAAMLLFFEPLFPTKRERRQAFLCGLGCVVMAFLSLSSTAYASIAIVLGLFALYRVKGISSEGRVVYQSISNKLLAGFAALFLVGLFFLSFNGLFDRFVDMINTLIFQKRYTSSYLERSDWTAVGLEAFFQSKGLGIGIGSVRTSNFFVNILASTGVLGAGAFALFLMLFFLARGPRGDGRASIFIGAAKRSYLPIMVGAFFAGTTPDFGIVPAVLFGIVAGFLKPFGLDRQRSLPLQKDKAYLRKPLERK